MLLLLTLAPDVIPLDAFADGIPGGAYTPIGMLCLVLGLPYLQMARGKLVPKSTVDAMEANYVRQLEDISHDRGEWRAAHRISETARQVLADQVEELLEHSRTSAQILRALPRPEREAKP